MKKLILTTIAIAFYTFGFAQQSSDLKVKDLVVIKEIPNIQKDSTKFLFRIYFKLSDPSIALKAHLLFGNSKDSGNAINDIALFSFKSGKYDISYNGYTNAIENFTGLMILNVPKSVLGDIKVLTFYIEDKTGKNTSKLYFEF